MTTKAVVPAAPASLGLSPAMFTQILTQAIDKGTAVEQLGKLLDLHERIERKLAAAEFAEAFAEFQAKCPPIEKNKLAPKAATNSGATYGGYRYATLDEIARTVNPILGPLGFSYGWGTAISDDGKRCTVTC